jgi:hypothetical protein
MVRRVQQLYGQSPAATPAGDPVQAAGKSSKSQPALSVKPPHGSDVSSVTALHSVPPSNIIPRTRVWIRGITNFDLRIRCCEERPRLIFPNSATLRCEHVSLYPTTPTSKVGSRALTQCAPEDTANIVIQEDSLSSRKDLARRAHSGGLQSYIHAHFFSLSSRSLRRKTPSSDFTRHNETGQAVTTSQKPRTHSPLVLDLYHGAGLIARFPSRQRP